MGDFLLAESPCGDGILYRPSDEGDAPAPLMLLCHGVGGHHGNLLRLAQALHSEGVTRVRMIDLPGHGRSTSQLVDLRQVDDTLRLALAQCHSEGRPVFALSVSAGVWFFSDQAPGSMAGLILINPITLDDIQPPEGQPLKEIDVRRRLLSRFFSEPAIRRMDSDTIGRPRLRIGVARELARRSAARDLPNHVLITILTREDPLKSMHVRLSNNTVCLEGDSHGVSEPVIVAQVTDTIRRAIR